MNFQMGVGCSRLVGWTLAIGWLACLLPLSRGADVFWDSNSGGDWHLPTNWSNDLVPGAGDNVTIDQPGNLQIVLQGPASIYQLMSQESILINHVLTLAADSEVHGTVTLVLRHI